MTLTVVSNEDQYRVLLKNRSDLSGMKILCDNPAFYGFLKSNGVSFDIIDEEMIRDKWESINTWACEKALLWDDAVGEKNTYEGIELSKTMHAFFSQYLAVFLKNYVFTNYVYEKFNPKEILVYDNIPRPELPLANGNYFFNKFLSEYGRQKSLKVNTLKLDEKDMREKPLPLKEKIRTLVGFLYGRIVRVKKKDSIFLVSGTLKHLAPVLEGLKEKGENVAIFDFDFNFEKFIFCLNKNIPYLIASCFSKNGSAGNSGYRKHFIDVIDTLKEKRWFSYNSTDLSSFVCEELTGNTKEYLNQIDNWIYIYNMVLKKYRISRLLLSEDMSPNNAFLAAFFRSRGIKVFSLLHGCNDDVPISLPESSRRFFLTDTFLHSEYQKDLFSSRGWAKEYLHVTGLPRYDRLVSYKDIDSRKPGIKPMKILFCGGLLHEYSPDNPVYNNYTGVTQYAVGNNMKAYLKDVIEAIDRFDITLMVKPHYNWDKGLWDDFIAKNKRRDNIVLFPSQADFIDLIKECDAMTIGYWSTTVMEAIILGRPVIVIDYARLAIKHPFVQNGLCAAVWQKDQLKDAVKNLYTTFSEKRKSAYPSAEDNKEFYLGKNDGLNTQRVLEKIMASQ
jgi:hypothetical protein